METVLTSLKLFDRFRQLEARLPEMEVRRKEAKERVREAADDVAVAKWELDKAGNGSFLDRLLGKQEEKKEKAHRRCREAQATEAKVRQALEQAEKEWEAAKADHEALTGSWEAYLKEKQRYLASGEDPEILREEEIPLLCSIGAEELWLCISDLEEARIWMQEDIRRQYVREENRKLEFLGKAREHAGCVRNLLAQLPENSLEIPSYLRDPDSYILGVTMANRQLDRLNIAQEQLRNLRRELKER